MTFDPDTAVHREVERWVRTFAYIPEDLQLFLAALAPLSRDDLDTGGQVMCLLVEAQWDEFRPVGGALVKVAEALSRDYAADGYAEAFAEQLEGL